MLLVLVLWPSAPLNTHLTSSLPVMAAALENGEEFCDLESRDNVLSLDAYPGDIVTTSSSFFNISIFLDLGSSSLQRFSSEIRNSSSFWLDSVNVKLACHRKYKMSCSYKQRSTQCTIEIDLKLVFKIMMIKNKNYSYKFFFVISDRCTCRLVYIIKIYNTLQSHALILKLNSHATWHRACLHSCRPVTLAESPCHMAQGYLQSTDVGHPHSINGHGTWGKVSLQGCWTATLAKWSHHMTQGYPTRL